MAVQEEAHVVTGCTDPEAAALAVLEQPGAAVQWCVVKLGARGALLRCKGSSEVHRAQGFQVGGAGAEGGWAEGGWGPVGAEGVRLEHASWWACQPRGRPLAPALHAPAVPEGPSPGACCAC